MFFWLIAIPFFVIIAMFTLFRLPSSGLHEPEDIQDTAMAFRMVLQHDAAAKLMQEYQATGESDMFDEGSYDLGGDTWKETLMDSGYLPASFIPDTDNITTYIRCLNGLRLVTSCRDATGIYMVTAATPPSESSITTRWFEHKGAINLASQLKKYEGSFPIKPNVSIPKKPRKEEGESDEDFAIRLNEYKETKAEYKLLKRNYYSFGTNLPRPKTVVGQVKAYPFGEESADSRAILRRIKEVGGEVVFEKEDMPTDLPSGSERSDSIDFNGEAVIFTASGSCNQGPCACTKGTDCGTGAYCLSGTCSTGCGTYGFDANRTCYTTCTSDSQCPEGYFCDSGVCGTTKPCSSDSDCFSGSPYCYNGYCSATQCTTNADCSSVSNKPYCKSNICSNALYSGNFNFTKIPPESISTQATVTVVAGKYKFDLRASGWGGTWVATKTFSKSTSLQIRIIGHGSVTRYSDAGYGFGIGLLEGSTIKIVAGAGGRNTSGGGGYVGGWGRDDYGYSWDGTRTSYSQATSGSGTGRYYAVPQYAVSGEVSNVIVAYGGTGYCASDYSCTGTYGTWGGNASITITYCGPNSSSACP